MIHKGAALDLTERHQEFLALIKMLEYTKGIAASLSTGDAASQLDQARQTLLSELEQELGGQIAVDALTGLSLQRAGHC